MRNSVRLLSAFILWMLGVTAASAAACITGQGAAANDTLFQLDQVQVGQCSVVVSGSCRGRPCLAPAKSLDGWVASRPDVNPHSTFQVASSDSATLRLASNASEGLSDTLNYNITGGEGVASMGGRQINMPFEPGGQIIFSRASNNTYSFITPISPNTITLSQSGGTWNGKDSTWAGLPMELVYDVADLGAGETSLRIYGSGPMATVDLTMLLSLQGGPRPARPANPPASTTPARRPSPVSRENNAPSSPTIARSDCGRLEDVENAVRAMGNAAAIAEVERIKREVGFTPTGNVTNGMCVSARARILEAGLLDAQPTPTGPSQSDQSACGRMEAAENRVRATGNQRAIAAMEQIKREVGFTPTGNITNGMCESVRARIIAAGLQNPTQAQPAQGTPAREFCGTLRREASGILRSGDGALNDRLLESLVRNQIFALSEAVDEALCANVLAELGISAPTPSVTPQNLPLQQGEDPITMIEGGREEIPGAEGDFAPLPTAPARTTTQARNDTANTQAIDGDICATANQAVIMIVAAGSVPEMRRLSELLNQYKLNDKFNNPPACQAMLDTLFAEGVL